MIQEQVCLLCGLRADVVPSSGFETCCLNCPDCGQYAVTRIYGKFEWLTQAPELKRQLMSHRVRTHPDDGTIPTIDRTWLADAAIVEPTVLAKQEHLLRLIGQRMPRVGQMAVIERCEWPLYCLRGVHELDSLLGLLQDQNLIETSRSGDEVTGLIRRFHARLTAVGWTRLAELGGPGRSQLGFVAMAFGPQFEEIYNGGLAPGIAQTNFTPHRVDKEAYGNKEYNGKICDRIVADIRASAFLVADVTNHRQGVYFEAGLAMGLGLPVIWTCRKDQLKRAHFDTRQYKHIDWSTHEELRNRLALRILATVPGARLRGG